ncbi:5-oxoprolinase subunit PxpB [Pseudomonas sp. 7P_10.2_Bac1]|uniref:5-oxoprolinase subunit PxpB n=1 Tax=Pseudomonas sp. 7P_10.2_Bac1 TaxID=2971614 RepID=UPI0021CA00B3|nr:5-oxoprolinase subunit PxpB [Pseudomonas sp. 7P_10.2_Bac1]MCU1728592.1 5-oxoprolinase subunit PxpB [Pseudomonas sp. 7P_10.2_Bac1]
MTLFEPHLATSHAFDTAVRISLAGTDGLLLDVSCGPFDKQLQQRLWALNTSLRDQHRLPGLVETVPGVNNLLVIYDPHKIHPNAAAQVLSDLWLTTQPAPLKGNTFVIEVTYGGERGMDLDYLAEQTGLCADEIVTLHSAATYTVAAIGSMPGFPYLVGLPRELEVPRRQIPRTLIPKGSVVVAGEQASLFPCAGPCGWHVIGHADFDGFDSQAIPPALLSPGDTLVFRPKGQVK